MSVAVPRDLSDACGQGRETCHRPANVIASRPGEVNRKKGRKIRNGQMGLPQRLGRSPAVEDGASQGARRDERSSLALDWRWPLPQRTERIVSMNLVSGSVPPVPTQSVGRVHDKTHQVCAFKRGKCASLDPSSSNCDSGKETLRNLESSRWSNGKKYVDASVGCEDCTPVCWEKQAALTT